MNAVELKKYIFNKELIEFVLNSIGCHSIKYHPNKEFWSCANYNGDNVGAINVKNNKYLNVRNYTRENDFPEGSDIISLVQYNKNCSFIDALKYLHNILGLKFTISKQKQEEPKKDILDIFKKHKTYTKAKVNIEEINDIEKKALNDYVPLLYIGWFREGIMPWTRDKFGLCYSYKRRRVIIPIRHWQTGILVGTNARTTVDNWEEFGIRKYDITPSYKKSLNLYGLYENKQDIEKKKIITIVESEKSVLKRDSLNDPTLVALSGKTMSDEQVSIIMGLDVYEVVVALDKDVPIEEVWNICEKIYIHKKVSYIWDSWGLLGEKDSPADASNEIYKFLFEHRVRYDSDKQRQYMNKLNEKYGRN